MTIKEKTSKVNNSKAMRLTRDFFYRLRIDNVSSHAASCAFFIFMSLIPMLILICSLLPFTPLKEQNLIDLINREIPGSVSGLLVSMVREVYDKSIGIVSVAAVTTLWSAGKGVNSLITGLNAIEHVTPKRNGLVTRLFASLYTLIFLASILLYLILMVYGRVAKRAMVGYFPTLSKVFEIVVLFRSAITIIIMTVVFMILFAVLPAARMKIRVQFVGAFFTAVSWTLFSYFFSLYVENYGAFSLYGSFATIIILCFWLYICMYLVFIGANLNRYFRPLMMALDKKFASKNAYKGQSESLEED